MCGLVSLLLSPRTVGCLGLLLSFIGTMIILYKVLETPHLSNTVKADGGRSISALMVGGNSEKYMRGLKFKKWAFLLLALGTLLQILAVLMTN